jgi:hypothetical protein
MIYDPEKQKKLREIREREKREKASQNFKKYNAGKNKKQTARLVGEAAVLAKNATPWGVLSLLGEFNIFSDWMYGAALFAAIFKDLLDIIEITGIGYAIVVVATFCAGIFIAMMMLLGSFSNEAGRKQQKIIRSWLILGGGTIMELIPGIDFVPIETLTVIIIYALLLSHRKQFKEKNKNNNYFEEPDYA